jgi:hypothetical protein
MVLAVCFIACDRATGYGVSTASSWVALQKQYQTNLLCFRIRVHLLWHVASWTFVFWGFCIAHAASSSFAWLCHCIAVRLLSSGLRGTAGAISHDAIQRVGSYRRVCILVHLQKLALEILNASWWDISGLRDGGSRSEEAYF